MNKKVCVIGSSNTDMILKLSRVPVPGETIIGGAFSTAAGGKGANQAVAAARAGGSVAFIARVGNDAFGRQAVDGFEKEGIDVAAISVDDDETSGVALIFVGEDGENSIGVASGANACLSEADAERHRSIIEGSDVVLVQLETPVATIETAARMASEAGRTVILNPAPATALPDSLLAKVSIITPNETEAELLTGIKVDSDHGIREAATALHRKGIPVVIITLGKRGVFLSGVGGEAYVPAHEVRDVVDTTAAGDTFNGALAVAIAEGKSVMEAVRFANAAAAISVTRLGAQPSAPHREEISGLLCGTADC